MSKKSKCPFANLLGKPGEGIHSFRIFGFAGADILLTLAAAKFIAAKKNKSFIKVSAQLVALGILLHRIFGVNTTLNNMIFKDKIECMLDDDE